MAPESRAGLAIQRSLRGTGAAGGEGQIASGFQGDEAGLPFYPEEFDSPAGGFGSGDE